MKTGIFCLCLLAALTLIGCGGSGVVGHWKGDARIHANQGFSPFAGMAKDLADSLTLDVKSDHTYEMHVFSTTQGTWSQSGDLLTLTPPASASNPKPLIYKLTENGKSLSPVNPDPKQIALPFIRD